MKKDRVLQILKLKLGTNPDSGAVDIYREFVAATNSALEDEEATVVVIPISSALFIATLLEQDAEELEEELSE